MNLKINLQPYPVAESGEPVVALSPEDQERAVWQYVTRTLTLLEETEPSPEKLGGPTMRRMLIRLTGLIQALTQRHKIDEHGQCSECLANRTTRDMGCTVMPIAALYLVEPLTVVWWQILTRQGRTLTLDEISAWLGTTDIDSDKED